MNKCLIIGAGESEPSKIIKPQAEDYVIAADGGFDVLQQAGILPHVWIGDMDSTQVTGNHTKGIQNGLEEVQLVKLPKEKDDTDMLAAIRLGLERGYREFLLYGSLGGRLDHTIANIQCLQFLKERGATGRLYGKNETVELIQNETIRFCADQKGMISVFAFGGEARGVTEKGLKYELEQVTLVPGFPIGVSNEFIGCESEITVEEGRLLICIANDV